MVIKKGEGITRIVTVLKVKNNVPTKIEVDGREYSLVSENQFNGGRKK